MQPGPTSQTEAAHTAGFTLLEMLCVLAVIGLILAIAAPAPNNTSASGLRSLSIATAALLKSDRTAALKTGESIATQVDVDQLVFRSGASNRVLAIPPGVKVSTALARRCDRSATKGTIIFFPDGASCGGVITLERSGDAYEVRVNWYTGLPTTVRISSR